MKTTDFLADIKRGGVGELIFKEDFLDFLNINYQDVTGSQKYQIIDSDYLTKIGLYEIKTNYKDNDILIFEDYTNCNINLGKISYGWVYKTKSDLIVFISKTTRTMIFLPFNDKFKLHYKTIRENTELLKNQITEYNGNRWQSAYRKVPFKLLDGYISIYNLYKDLL
jgi:hypothetical protein